MRSGRIESGQPSPPRPREQPLQVQQDVALGEKRALLRIPRMQLTVERVEQDQAGMALVERFSQP
jgi:hypothetical protein